MLWGVQGSPPALLPIAPVPSQLPPPAAPLALILPPILSTSSLPPSLLSIDTPIAFDCLPIVSAYSSFVDCRSLDDILAIPVAD